MQIGKGFAKKYLLFTLALAGLAVPFSMLAVTPQLDYPTILGINITERIRAGDITLPEIANVAFIFFVIIGGVAAFISLVIAGFKWLTSTANPEALSDAKKRVLASLVGLVLLLASWIILNTIDPNLLTLCFGPNDPACRRTIVTEPPQAAKPEELTDGVIFYVRNPADGQITQLPVRFGKIKVEDTRIFPPDGIDLSGIGGAPYIIQIQFANPSKQIEVGGNIVNTLNYRYGAACFSKQNHQGRVRIAISTLDVKPPPVDFYLPRPGQQFPDPVFLNTIEPCQSILIFRVPTLSIYSLGDSIVFYELPFPQREEKIATELGIFTKTIGECLKIDLTSLPENCHNANVRTELHEVTGSALFVSADGQTVRLDNTINSLIIDKRDANGNRSGEWSPLSMEINTDRAGKYLIFLFSRWCPTVGRPGCHRPSTSTWFSGDSYVLQESVKDFGNKKEAGRLYWLNQDPPSAKPEAFVAFQIETVF